MGDRKSSTFPSPPRQEERPPLYIRVARELVQETVAFRQGITLTAGSFDSLTQLFFEILSTLLGVIYALQSVVSGSSVTTDFLNQILYGKVVPGMGLSILIGNLYYSWQAIRLTRKWGRQYTAQPYGLNTPAAFSFIYNILAPVFFANVATLGGNEAFQLAYNVSLAANFVSGLTSLVLGLFGPQILRLMPPAALLVPIAALGVAFLGLQQLCNSIAAPIVGYPWFV